MRAVKYNKNVYKRLDGIEGFTKSFPHLMQQLKRGNIWSWDDRAITTTLTQKQIDHIEALESNHKSEGFVVYAVLDTCTFIGDCETSQESAFMPVHMTSYLFISDEMDEISLSHDGVYYAMADVVNDTMNINEMGSVLIARCVAGGPRRIS